jgi:hypothetical protein
LVGNDVCTDSYVGISWGMLSAQTALSGFGGEWRLYRQRCRDLVGNDVRTDSCVGIWGGMMSVQTAGSGFGGE